MDKSKSAHELTELVFKDQLTQQGLADLRAKFPSELVFDMSDEAVFKAGRKVRTERNKLVDAIKQRRLDVTKELKDFGDNLSDTVTEIYSVSVNPFEKEDKRRKEIAAAAKIKLDKLLAEQRTQIAGIRQFLTDAISATSDQISGMVDAVGNIDAKDFHKELVHEAMEVIDEVKSTLADMLLKQIDAERLQEETIAAEKKTKLAEEALAKLTKETETKAKKIEEENDAKAKKIRLETETRENAAKQEKEITERIGNLRMIPMDVMGKNSTVIKNKIESIKQVKIDADSFLTHTEEATTARATVLEQLTQMLEQAEQIESITPVQNVATAIKQEPEQVAAQVEQITETQEQAAAPVKSEPVTLRGDITVWANKYLAGPNGEYAFEQLMKLLTNHNQ